MAFTYCTNCGEKIDESLDRCPYCNHPKGADRSHGYESEKFGKNENETSEDRKNGNPWERKYEQNGDQSRESGDKFGDGQDSQNGNPYGNGQNRDPFGNSQSGRSGNLWENGKNQDPYGNPYDRQYDPYGGERGPWQPRQKRKLSIGLLVFSIINIISGTCCAGSIFGIIGLFFAVTARDAMSEAEELRRKKISLAVNIIALILTVVFIVSFGISFVQNGGFEIFNQI